MSLKERLSHKNVDKIKQRLLQVDVLPTVSTMFEKIVKVIEDPSKNARDLEQVIALDQAVAMRILKIVNSPFYGYKDISSISKAVVLLGFHEVKNVVLSASLMSVIDVGYPVANLKIADFWLHSIAVACVARLLTKTFASQAKGGYLPPDTETFTFGLLHDIGKVVYIKEEPQLMEDLMALAKGRNISFAAAERVVNLSHSQIGWYLAEKWNLPEPLCQAIKEHHNPDPSGPHRMVSALIQLCDYLAVRLRIGDSGNPLPEPLGEPLLGILGLTSKHVDKIERNVEERRDQLIHMSKLLLPG